MSDFRLHAVFARAPVPAAEGDVLFFCHSLCSTHEPPPKGFVQCPCSRYSGEGFGTQCGLSAADDYMWEIGTAFVMNISLTTKNSSGATFRSTMTNMRTKEVIEVGQIYTTSPPAGKYYKDCSTMPVGGGSFQEYYDGGNFTNWAQISGPRYEGVAGSVDKATGKPVDVTPTNQSKRRLLHIAVRPSPSPRHRVHPFRITTMSDKTSFDPIYMCLPAFLPAFLSAYLPA